MLYLRKASTFILDGRGYNDYGLFGANQKSQNDKSKPLFNRSMRLKDLLVLLKRILDSRGKPFFMAREQKNIAELLQNLRPLDKFKNGSRSFAKYIIY